jgi:hypothetical protein
LNENTIKIKLFRTRQKLLTAARRLGKRSILRFNLAGLRLSKQGDGLPT